MNANEMIRLMNRQIVTLTVAHNCRITPDKQGFATINHAEKARGIVRKIYALRRNGFNGELPVRSYACDTRGCVCGTFFHTHKAQ